jgi:hypothetical protein
MVSPVENLEVAGIVRDYPSTVTWLNLDQTFTRQFVLDV